MSDPQIPPQLLTFDPDNWPGPWPIDTATWTQVGTGQGESLELLCQRQCWRRAQDAWSSEYYLTRAEFERLQLAQEKGPRT